MSGSPTPGQVHKAVGGHPGERAPLLQAAGRAPVEHQGFSVLPLSGCCSAGQPPLPQDTVPRGVQGLAMLEIDKSSSIDSYIALQQVVLKCAEPTGRAALAKPMHPAVCPLSVLRGPLRLKRNVDGRDFSLKAVPNEQPSFDVWVETLQVRPPQPIPPARPPHIRMTAPAACTLVASLCAIVTTADCCCCCCCRLFCKRPTKSLMRSLIWPWRLTPLTRTTSRMASSSTPPPPLCCLPVLAAPLPLAALSLLPALLLFLSLFDGMHAFACSLLFAEMMAGLVRRASREPQPCTAVADRRQQQAPRSARVSSGAMTSSHMTRMSCDTCSRCRWSRLPTSRM